MCIHAPSRPSEQMIMYIYVVIRVRVRVRVRVSIVYTHNVLNTGDVLKHTTTNLCFDLI